MWSSINNIHPSTKHHHWDIHYGHQGIPWSLSCTSTTWERRVVPGDRINWSAHSEPSVKTERTMRWWWSYTNGDGDEGTAMDVPMMMLYWQTNTVDIWTHPWCSQHKKYSCNLLNAVVCRLVLHVLHVLVVRSTAGSHVHPHADIFWLFVLYVKQLNKIEIETKPTAWAEASYSIMFAEWGLRLVKITYWAKVTACIYFTFTCPCFSEKRWGMLYQSRFTNLHVPNHSVGMWTWGATPFFRFSVFLAHYTTTNGEEKCISIVSTVIYWYRPTCFYPLMPLWKQPCNVLRAQTMQKSHALVFVRPAHMYTLWQHVS